MNSLRTDDILGAKPRVRHMPLNLIRERIANSAYFTNMQQPNPEPSNSPPYSPQQYAPPGSPIQYTNNDPSAYPFYARNRLSKEPKYTNYDFSRDENNYAQPRTPREQLPRISSEQKYSQPIYALRQDKSESRHIDNSLRDSQNRTYAEPEPIPSSRQSSSSKPISRNSEAVSRQSPEHPAQETKRIFRGLGFNIISNHKFEYAFEHSLPNRY
jgi:hypothetical protein